MANFTGLPGLLIHTVDMGFFRQSCPLEISELLDLGCSSAANRPAKSVSVMVGILLSKRKPTALAVVKQFRKSCRLPGMKFSF